MIDFQKSLNLFSFNKQIIKNNGYILIAVDKAKKTKDISLITGDFESFHKKNPNKKAHDKIIEFPLSRAHRTGIEVENIAKNNSALYLFFSPFNKKNNNKANAIN